MNLNWSVIAQSNIICLLIANIFPESNTLNFWKFYFGWQILLTILLRFFIKLCSCIKLIELKMNWLHYYDTKKSIHRYQKLHFFSFDKKMKMFRIVTYYYNCSLLFSNVFKTLQKVIWHAIFFQEKNSWNTIFPRNLIASLFLRLFVIPGFIDHHTCTIQLPSLFYDCVL